MGSAIDYTGRVFGQITVLSRVPSNCGTATRWLCRCKCGHEWNVYATNLRNGQQGCWGCKPKPNLRHGYLGTKTYRVWKGMITRCTNPRIPNWKDYGGRGITVCERWRNFSNFLADMGERPDGLTLDRTNNNGNYEPANCRWITQAEQCRNRRPRIKK